MIQGQLVQQYKLLQSWNDCKGITSLGETYNQFWDQLMKRLNKKKVLNSLLRMASAQQLHGNWGTKRQPMHIEPISLKLKHTN